MNNVAISIPASIIFYFDPLELAKRLSEISTPDLLDIYRKKEDEDVRQAMAPELAKRLSEIIKKGEFKIG
ncbi:MAG: hypothetical protein ABIC36_00110 [bacterium]